MIDWKGIASDLKANYDKQAISISAPDAPLNQFTHQLIIPLSEGELTLHYWRSDHVPSHLNSGSLRVNVRLNYKPRLTFKLLRTSIMQRWWDKFFGGQPYLGIYLIEADNTNIAKRLIKDLGRPSVSFEYLETQIEIPQIELVHNGVVRHKDQLLQYVTFMNEVIMLIK